MSRPAAAVHRVIKAYDVRGLVGEQIDEEFVADVGAAFARLVRDEGARRRVVIGHDMRDSSPALAAAFADGRDGPGPRRGPDRAGLHRSAVLRLRAAGLPRRDVHRQPQPGRLQRHQAVPRGCQAGRPGHRAGRDQRRGDRGRARDTTARAATIDRPRRARRLRRVPALAGRLGRAAPAAGRRRRRQRDGRSHRTRGAGTDSVDHGAAAVLRTRRLLPEPRGQPAGPGEPRRPAGARGRDGRRHRAGLRRRRRPVFRGRRTGASGIAVGGDRPGRRARAGQGDRRNRDPQPDHLTSGARAGRRARAARPCAPASATPTSRR